MCTHVRIHTFPNRCIKQMYPHANTHTHTHTHTQANGVQCFVLTIVLWAVGASLELFPAGWQYDHAPGMFAFLNMSALVLCCVLYIKGRYAPSTPDAGHSGNLIFDV